MPYTGLLVDHGGVLTTPVFDSFAEFCSAESLDPVAFRDALVAAARAPDSPFARVETGAASREEFERALARLIADACGVTVEPDGLKQRMFAGTRPDRAMLDAVRAARRAGIRTALVSNSWGLGDYPLDEYRKIFDEIVLSGEVGMRKPETSIYLHSAAALGVEPAACVFVDDLRVNVDGAERAGMLGILHRDAATTVEQLERAFAVELADPGVSRGSPER